jgi:hypothetical protein
VVAITTLVFDDSDSDYTAHLGPQVFGGTSLNYDGSATGKRIANADLMPPVWFSSMS